MKARHILPFVILCSLFLSCKDDRPFEDAYLWQNNASLTASLTTLLFEADASTQTVAITTNSGFGISVNQTWLTVERGSDNQTITVSVQANTTSSARNATITINASGKSQTINVNQSGVPQQTSDEEGVFTVTGNGKTVKFKMIKVQGGTFQMGSTSGEDNEQPVHSVTLTRDYFICETEVTQALWEAVTGGSGSYFDGRTVGDNYPAYGISYEDCQSFLSSLNSLLSSELAGNQQFRFPTEAEWEYAAKGGNKSNGYTYSGSNTVDDVAWHHYNTGSIKMTTREVKTKSPNELGLYDMSGNVQEWCYDWYGSYSSSAQTDPAGPYSSSGRVVRGGGVDGEQKYCRVTFRGQYDPIYSYSGVIGLRLCLGTPISEPVPSLSVSPTSLSFGASASSKTVNVTANGDYTFSTSASWLTITQSSDKTTLTVSATANPQTSERTATITLTLGSLTQTINVTQEANEDRPFTVTGNGKTVTFKMIKVEGGTFQMGSTTGDSNEYPVHSVTISKAYYMCETEVTQALWYAVMGQSSVSSSWSSSLGIGDNYPAYYISYEDCRSFLSTLNSKLSSQLGSGEQFRFPTEAEWEFAAKGGNKSQGYTYSGSNTISDVAWYNGNSSSTTHQLKTKSPNELGLYDMSGNLCEWCYDWYDYYSSTAQTDPTGPTSGDSRVLRGGSWLSYATYCRVANRNNDSPSNHYCDVGLRLCLGAPIE